jgi:hypothetical protein
MTRIPRTPFRPDMGGGSFMVHNNRTLYDYRDLHLLRKDRSVEGQMLSRTPWVDCTTVNSSKLGEELNMSPWFMYDIQFEGS